MNAVDVDTQWDAMLERIEQDPLAAQRLLAADRRWEIQYRTLDSGEREEWETGAKRDTQTGKPRYDLIPRLFLRRLADLYARGAEKYGENNWQRGIPLSRYNASLMRHLMAWLDGDETEDHGAAVAWNMASMMWTREQIRLGKLPESLDDV